MCTIGELLAHRAESQSFEAASAASTEREELRSFTRTNKRDRGLGLDQLAYHRHGGVDQVGLFERIIEDLLSGSSYSAHHPHRLHLPRDLEGADELHAA